MIKLKNILNEQDDEIIQGINFSNEFDAEATILNSRFTYLSGPKMGRYNSGKYLKDDVFDNYTDKQKANRSFVDWIKNGLERKFIKRDTDEQSNIADDTITPIDRKLTRLVLYTTNAALLGGSATTIGTDEEGIFQIINSLSNMNEYEKINDGLIGLQNFYDQNSFGFNSEDDYITIRRNGTRIKSYEFEEFIDTFGENNPIMGVMDSYDLTAWFKYAVMTAKQLRYMPNTENGFLGLISNEMDPSEERDNLLLILVSKGFVQYNKKRNSVTDKYSTEELYFEADPETIRRKYQSLQRRR